MGKNLGIFFLTFVLAFGGGYFFFQSSGTEGEQAANGTAQPNKQESNEPAKQEAQPTATASAEGEIFVQQGCTACHAVDALGVAGGATGPDLSKAFVNVPDKHGLPVDQFLQKPTTAVMASVIGGKPLKDEELKAIVDALKTASEK